jgi:hypothetical protein
MKFIQGSALDTSGVETAAIGFLHDGVFIVNARLSDCGRFNVDPLNAYGVTESQADELKELNIKRDLEAYQS